MEQNTNSKSNYGDLRLQSHKSYGGIEVRPRPQNRVCKWHYFNLYCLNYNGKYCWCVLFNYFVKSMHSLRAISTKEQRQRKMQIIQVYVTVYNRAKCQSYAACLSVRKWGNLKGAFHVILFAQQNCYEFIMLAMKQYVTPYLAVS